MDKMFMYIFAIFQSLISSWKLWLVIIIVQWFFPTPAKNKFELQWLRNLLFFSAINTIIFMIISKPMINYFFWHPVFCLYSYVLPFYCYCIVILAGSFVTYWTHRLGHHWKVYWKFVHSIHHQQRVINFFSANYVNPMEALLNSGILLYISVGFFGMGLSETAITFYIFNALSYFQHANIATPRCLGYILTRPEMHRKHHEFQYHRNNYGIIPLWDIVFQTFENPRRCPLMFGLNHHCACDIEEFNELESINNDASLN